MENMVNVFKNKKILVTGHTGFKGTWLSLLLSELGADVAGYSLYFPSEPNLCTEAGLPSLIRHHIGDIRDAERLQKVFDAEKPEFVFHLAAQPIVREGYARPRETFETNLMGTVHLFEAVRKSPSVRVVVNVTTDKCYENRELKTGYRENDPLGGYDPYSASKAGSEMITKAYQASFFPAEKIREHGVAVASARAGNVIGGGDWGKDRIIPDCVRALSQNEPVFVRNPDSIRPWQHVLECLSGYLSLAARLKTEPALYTGAWNFGPLENDNTTVREVVEKIIGHWGSGSWKRAEKEKEKSETKCLLLNCEKAVRQLGWKPVWNFEQSLKATAIWFKRYYQDRSLGFDLCREQIGEYIEAAEREKIFWA